MIIRPAKGYQCLGEPSIVQQRASWDGFLGTVSRVVPEDVWLLSLSAQEPTAVAPTESSSTAAAAGGTSSVTLTGYTSSQPSVARMIADGRARHASGRGPTSPHDATVRSATMVTLPAVSMRPMRPSASSAK